MKVFSGIIIMTFDNDQAFSQHEKIAKDFTIQRNH